MADQHQDDASCETPPEPARPAEGDICDVTVRMVEDCGQFMRFIAEAPRLAQHFWLEYKPDQVRRRP